jgi:hypothetical protein
MVLDVFESHRGFPDLETSLLHDPATIERTKSPTRTLTFMNLQPKSLFPHMSRPNQREQSPESYRLAVAKQSHSGILTFMNLPETGRNLSL